MDEEPLVDPEIHMLAHLREFFSNMERVQQDVEWRHAKRREIAKYSKEFMEIEPIPEKK
jgi:hypothetical protein